MPDAMRMKRGAVMMKKFAVTAIFGFLILAASVWAQAPNLVNYQGVLKDSGGNPLTGTYSITFSLYSVSTGGTALWTETQGSVSVSNGLFSVLLGSVTPLTPSEFSGTDRWLGVTVGGDPEMTPRQRIASVPYALRTPPTANHQNVFYITSGSHYINTTSWTNMATAAGTATINGPFCYALQADGMWVDTAGHRIYLRLAFTPSGGGTTTYIPDSAGHKQYYYINDSRLDSWMNTQCVSSLAAGDYDVVLQWRGEDTNNTRWHSTYGYLNLAIW
jgi:hypothetical protein